MDFEFPKDLHFFSEAYVKEQAKHFIGRHVALPGGWFDNCPPEEKTKLLKARIVAHDAKYKWTGTISKARNKNGHTFTIVIVAEGEDRHLISGIDVSKFLKAHGVDPSDDLFIEETLVVRGEEEEPDTEDGADLIERGGCYYVKRLRRRKQRKSGIGAGGSGVFNEVEALKAGSSAADAALEEGKTHKCFVPGCGALLRILPGSTGNALKHFEHKAAAADSGLGRGLAGAWHTFFFSWCQQWW